MKDSYQRYHQQSFNVYYYDYFYTISTAATAATRTGNRIYCQIRWEAGEGLSFVFLAYGEGKHAEKEDCGILSLDWKEKSENSAELL